jgi:hypothetical protein
MVQMIHHRHPLAAVLLCGQHTDMIDAVSGVLPNSCSVRAVQMSELEVSQNSNAAIAGPPDLVVVDESVSRGREALLGLVKEGQWLIQSGPDENFSIVNGVKDENALYPVLEVPVGDPQKGARLVQLLARGNVRLVDTVQNEQLDVIIVHASSQNEDGYLIAHLSDRGYNVKSTTVERFTLPENQENEVVVIDDRHGTLLSRLSDQSFEAVKSLIRANLPMVWLTRGVRQGACVFGGMVQGFLRVIRSEQASARIVQLDVDQEEQLADVAEALLSVLRDAPTKDSGKDTEFWLHRGIMNIARVVPNHQLNTELAPPASLASHVSEVKQLPDGVRLKSSIVDGQLTLTYDEPESSSALGTDEIEIQVLASELQTTPSSPVVVSGHVLRRGSSVRADVAAGDHVIGWTTDSLTTVVRTACYIRWDTSTNSDMTTILAGIAALSKVVNMCITTTSVSSNDQILALPGPAPTLHALVRLGKAMQWDVRLLARSPEEQQEYISKFNNGSVLLADDIRTCLREKDRRWVVLAHDFSPLSQEVWRQLPARSVFVLNEAMLDSAPDALPFSRSVSFMPTSVKTLHTAAASEVLQRALDLVQKYPGLANDIASVHDISEFSPSNNLLHAVPATKVGVVTYRYHDSLVRVSLR